MAVTDLWHRTLVYFGMADEPDDYGDEYDDEFAGGGVGLARAL